MVIVAILVLGLPLLFVSFRLISEGARTELLHEAQAIQPYVETRLARGEPIRVEVVRRLVPLSDRIVIARGKAALVRTGPATGSHPLTQTLTVSSGAKISVSRAGDEVRSQQLRIGVLIGLVAVLAAAVAAAVATVSARRLTVPILDLADRAARLGSGDFRAVPARHDILELDRVSDVLDRSAAQIAGLVRRERDLMSDISHQMRTRLTALRIRVEEIISVSGEPEVRAEAEAALEQAERLTGVIDELLAQARNASAAEAQTVDVAAELDTIVREYEPALAELGRQVRVRAGAGLCAMATPGRLDQAIGVLVENATDHGAGVVSVSAYPNGANVVIEVTDQGPGVAPELAGEIFQRGVSGGGGTGIGLALARALVESDGGRLELRSAVPAVFAVYLARVGEP